MEIKEAIAVLRFVMPGDPTSTVRDACETAISALEKQIAIPPKESEGYDADGFWRPDMLFCPACEKPIDPFEHHCECGQKIDWTE